MHNKNDQNKKKEKISEKYKWGLVMCVYLHKIHKLFTKRLPKTE